MLDPTAIYNLVLGLVETNDWDAFDAVVHQHPEHIPTALIPHCRTIGDTVTALVDNYDFTVSLAFQKTVNGRSASYAEMKRRLESDPMKRKQHRERFLLVVRNLQSSDEAYDLLPESEHAKLDTIRQNIQRIVTGG